MWILRTGKADSVLRSVEALRRERYDDIAAVAPDLPAFVPFDDLTNVRVRFRGIGPETIVALDAAVKSVEGPLGDVDDPAAEVRRRSDVLRSAKRQFLSEAIAEVTGLVEEVEGREVAITVGSAACTSLVDDELDALEAAQIDDVLVGLCRWWTNLPGTKKKHCGQRARSTSATSTAGAATSDSSD